MYTDLLPLKKNVWKKSYGHATLKCLDTEKTLPASVKFFWCQKCIQKYKMSSFKTRPSHWKCYLLLYSRLQKNMYSLPFFLFPNGAVILKLGHGQENRFKWVTDQDYHQVQFNFKWFPLKIVFKKEKKKREANLQFFLQRIDGPTCSDNHILCSRTQTHTHTNTHTAVFLSLKDHICTFSICVACRVYIYYFPVWIHLWAAPGSNCMKTSWTSTCWYLNRSMPHINQPGCS